MMCCMLMICIWDELTISQPVGFDIYSAQQTESLWWYNTYYSLRFSFTEDWRFECNAFYSACHFTFRLLDLAPVMVFF